MVDLQRNGVPRRHHRGRPRRRRHFTFVPPRHVASHRERYALADSAEHHAAGAASRHRRSFIATTRRSGLQCVDDSAGSDVASIAPARSLRFFIDAAGRGGFREAGGRYPAGKDAGPAGSFCFFDCGHQIEHRTATGTPIATRATEARDRQCEIVDRPTTA
jgi:hypothetical protein